MAAAKPLWSGLRPSGHVIFLDLRVYVSRGPELRPNGNLYFKASWRQPLQSDLTNIAVEQIYGRDLGSNIQ